MTRSPDEVDEPGLDPEDWEPIRAVGHRMVDELVDFLRGVRDQPAWRAIPEEVKARFRAPPPREGASPASVYEALRTSVLPYRLGNVHPRFWARVMGTGTAMGAFAELAAAAMNNNLSGLESTAVHVEAQVLRWLKSLLGFPETASGLLTSGCSLANLVALQVARGVHAGGDVAVDGLPAMPRRLVAYASDEAHSAVGRACVVLGLGAAALRRIPTDSEYRIRLEALARAVAEDRAAGRHPFCVVGTAGTVNTGATDDLDALADFAAASGMWFHVDGAFGALAALSPALAPRLHGMARADSIAFDLHKWGAAPYGVGCVLVRDAEAHHRTFQTSAAYLAPLPRGPGSSEFPAHELGPELSRGFRGLRIWMAFQEHGTDRLARVIEQNVAQAEHLAGRVRREPELELLAPVPLNLVCFRYRGRAVSGARLDALNAELVMRIQESGLAVPSTTRLRGRTAIRIAIVNHRTRVSDLDLLVQAVLETGRALEAEAR